MIAYLTVLLAALAISPTRSDADTLFRSQLASAIAAETSDPDEQRVLVRIAWYESNYRPWVASCRVTGDHGKALGAFQIQPRTVADKRDACGTLNAQVRVALRYVRRSLEVCAGNSVETRLNLYTSGDCRRGSSASRLRWGN